MLEFGCLKKENQCMTWLDEIQFNQNGLVPAIAQDKDTGRVLMMAWQNRQALELTLATGMGVYFSRSRNKLWYKGESSGHQQVVHDIYTDCDGDVILLTITQVGGIACHTGRQSCFYQKLDSKNHTWQTCDNVIKPADEIYGTNHAKNTPLPNILPQDVLSKLDMILNQRKTANKDSSYVASLYHKGLNKILEKVGEEAVESIIAAKELQTAIKLGQDFQKQRSDFIYEVADVWFHTLVALADLNLSSNDILTELARRFGLSGIDEKNARTAIH